MESGVVGQIVLFGGLILLSILQSVIKKKNKRNAAGQYDEHENPYDDYLPGEEWQWDDKNADSQKGYIFTGEESSKETAAIATPRLRSAASDLTKRVSAKRSNEIDKQKDSILLEDNEDENNEFLEKFDIRKAVIYSEILKPKFIDNDKF